MLVETNEGVKTHSSHRLVPGKKNSSYLFVFNVPGSSRALWLAIRNRLGHETSVVFEGVIMCYHCTSHVVNKHLVTGPMVCNSHFDPQRSLEVHPLAVTGKLFLRLCCGLRLPNWWRITCPPIPVKSLFGGPFQMHPLLRKGIADFTAIYHNTRPPNQLRSRAKKPWQQSISAATTTRATWRWDSLCDTNLMADYVRTAWWNIVKYYPSETFVSMIFKANVSNGFVWK